ncbi:hypothetical protein AAG906_000325 [Vitis piasezkii]
MAWELMNEPRCQADSSERMGWVQEMASFVKSMDKNHLLEIGMEGFYGDSMPEKKPLVMAELGKSSKDQGYSLSARDQYLSTVYQRMNNFESSGGGISGSLVWQLMAEGMDSYGDGHGIILSQDASTRGFRISIDTTTRSSRSASSMAGNGPIPELDVLSACEQTRLN